MFIWKHVDIPPDLIQQIQEEFKSAIPKNETFFQIVNLKIQEFMGLEIQQAVLIQVRPNCLNSVNIHKDEVRPNNCVLALNFPWENCEDSSTIFWKTDQPAVKKFTHNGFPYDHYDIKYCEKISEFKLTQPVIFNTRILHSVINPTDKWRRAISLRFNKDPWNLT